MAALHMTCQLDKLLLEPRLCMQAKTHRKREIYMNWYHYVYHEYGKNYVVIINMKMYPLN